MALSGRLKKELRRDLKVDHNYSKLYAICIHHLIKDKLSLFDILVICDDEPFKKVYYYLNLLFSDNQEWHKKEIISIGDLRKILGKKVCSSADGVANSYRKRALRTKVRQQKGKTLNVVTLNYDMITQKWNEIEKI